MAAEIVIAVVGKVAEYLVAPIGRQFGYLLCYNKNIENFKTQVEKLKEKNLGVQQDVDDASRNCERIKDEVTSWLEGANKNQAVAKEILEDDEKVGKSCLNIKSRYKTSKKASKLTKDLAEFIAEGKFKKVANPPEPMGLVHTPPVSMLSLVDDSDKAAPTSNGSSGEFESRSRIVSDIMISLKDEKVQVVGIWGMGGVGKTTMAKEVLKRVTKEGTFEEVAMVTVSEKPDLKKVQNDIAEALGLSFTEQSLSARANRLHNRLTQPGKNNMPKKILIILDDVWARLDLIEVGILSENDTSNCRILLTSRNKGVCDQMRTDRTHFINVLTDGEARKLFLKTARIPSDATDLLPIANDIVQECKGLPIAVTTIARVLVGGDTLVWKRVLRKLKDSTLEGEYASVYSVFAVSYDSLTSDEVKELFLLCCLFPEDFDIPIEELVRYGVGRKLFKGISKLHVRREDGHVHIKELQKSTLLLESDKVDCVKLHDLVRDFALSIGSKGEFLVKFGDGIKKWPIEDVSERYTSISLQCNEMDVLPGGLKYPNLKTLLLAGSEHNLLIFPDLFFEGMRKVEVLVLKYVLVNSLPRSLQFLTSLRTLSLNHCRLEGDLSLIGELAVLEILIFAGAEIQDLPIQIGKLSRLRLFDLTGCKKVQRISPGIIKSLVQLEELYLRGTSIRWAEQVSVGDEGSSTVRETYASFSEVTSLSSLIVIEIDIPYQVLLLLVDLTFLKNLERFYVCVGGTYEIKIKNVFQNILCCKVDKSILLDGIAHVLGKKTEVLYLNVPDLLTLPQEYSELGDLELDSCDGMVSLINIVALSLMNEMALFGKLRSVNVKGCHKLKSILPVSVVKGLAKLERLEVSDCGAIEELFTKERRDEDEEAGRKIVLIRLQLLKLSDLPNLVCFCKGIDKVEFPQFEDVNLIRLPKFKSFTSNGVVLFYTKQVPRLRHLWVEECESIEVVFDLQRSNEEVAVLTQLQTIYLWKLKNVRHVWSKCPRVLPRGSLQNLSKLDIWKCDNLRYVFTPSIAKALVGLEILEIWNCMNLEAIVAEEEDDKIQGSEETIIIFFPQLQHLSLKELPKLQQITPEPTYHINYSSCEGLTIIGCKKLNETLTDTTLEVNINLEQNVVCRTEIEVASLIKSTVNSFYNLEEVGFPQLYSVNLSSHSKFDGFDSKGVLFNTKQVPKLYYLTVWECDSIEVVFDLQRSNEEVAVLTQLDYIILINLKNVRHVWSKCPRVLPRGSLQNLSNLCLVNCDNLRYVFTPSIAKALVGLEELKIKRCMELEAIVAEEEDDKMEASTGETLIILFPQLKTLYLKELPKLQVITPEPAYAINLSSCKSLKMRDCGKLNKTLADTVPEVNTNLVQNLACCIEIEVASLIKSAVSSIHNLEEVGFPQLEDATLSSHPKFDGFDSKGVLFNTKQVPRLCGLLIKECESIEVVFDLQRSNEEVAVLTQLQTIYLWKLKNVRHVWSNCPRVLPRGSLQKLNSLQLLNCDNLRYVFTLSMAKALVGLEELRIENCMELEAIVAEEEEDEDKMEISIILFPRLTNLSLTKLPKLQLITPKPYVFTPSITEGIHLEKIVALEEE